MAKHAAAGDEYSWLHNPIKKHRAIASTAKYKAKSALGFGLLGASGMAYSAKKLLDDPDRRYS